MTPILSRIVLSFAATALLAACATTTPNRPDASATIAPASGSQVGGTVDFYKTPAGLRVAAKLSGLTPGEHGFHVHEVGDCSAPDASSAKGHFNPLAKAMAITPVAITTPAICPIWWPTARATLRSTRRWPASA